MIVSNVQSCRPYATTTLRKVDNKQNSVAQNKSLVFGKFTPKQKATGLMVGYAAIAAAFAAFMGIAHYSDSEKMHRQAAAKADSVRNVVYAAETTRLLDSAKMAKAAKAIEHAKP